MRLTRLSVSALFLVLAAGLCWAQASTKLALNKEAATEAKSLLRKDLLQIKKQDVVPPTRNIFAPRAGSSRPGNAELPGSPLPAVDFPEVDTSATIDETAEAPQVLAVELRYIGFIESRRRMVALLLFEGQTIAVVEGDVVGEGVRIGKITSQQIEVILPDSSKRTFSLEGE